LDKGQVVGREFIVARRDPPTLFDLIEEPFDQVARTVEIRAEADRLLLGGMLAQARFLVARALIQSAS
jgi:hypothetical protein